MEQKTPFQFIVSPFQFEPPSVSSRRAKRGLNKITYESDAIFKRFFLQTYCVHAGLNAMCRFFVDDVPIRRYPNRSPETFPLRPMWVYGSIWDASSWATDDGRYRADYRFQPFVAHFTHFVARGCTIAWQPRCRPPASSPSGFGLSWPQYAAMIWAQRRSLVYDYCRDPKRDHSLTPECR